LERHEVELDFLYHLIFAENRTKLNQGQDPKRVVNKTLLQR